jgi:spermidine synthase
VPPPPRPVARRSRAGTLGLLFATGLTSMAMEVVWIRQFTPYLGTVVYAFASILTVYLAATFVGSTGYRLWSRERAPDDTAAVPPWVWTVVGLAGLIPLLAADPRLAPVFSEKGTGVGLGQSLRVTLGIAGFCTLVGFLTPMLVDRWSAGEPDRAGAAYAVNVLGSLVGPLVAAFALLPVLSERSALLILAGGFLVVGAAAAFRQWARGTERRAPRDRSRSLGAVTAAAVLLLALPLVVFTRDFATRFSRSIVLHDNTATVIAYGDGLNKRLLVNGVGMTALTSIPKMMAHLPMAFLATPPRRSLVICFGMGTTFRSLLSWGVPATAVELVPSVPTVFGYYHDDGAGLVRSPLATIVIDDGRRFLERLPDTYDVMTIDPPPPAEAAGSSLLYSAEFYALVQKRLRPGGVLQQWLPSTEPFIAASVARALGEVFPHVRVFRSWEDSGWHFIASAEPLRTASAAELAARMPPGASRDLLEWNPEAAPEDRFRQLLEHEIPLRSVIDLAPRAPVLRDDRPVNEYFFVRRILRRAFPALQS